MSIVECKRCKRTIIVNYRVPRKDEYVCDICIKKSLGASHKSYTTKSLEKKE